MADEIAKRVRRLATLDLEDATLQTPGPAITNFCLLGSFGYSRKTRPCELVDYAMRERPELFGRLRGGTRFGRNLTRCTWSALSVILCPIHGWLPWLARVYVDKLVKLSSRRGIKGEKLGGTAGNIIAATAASSRSMGERRDR